MIFLAKRLMISIKAGMEKDKKQQHLLEKEFTATFLRELMPGILHNFANPLNGIMGRSKLLERRIDMLNKKLSEQHPDAAGALLEEIQKIKNDIRSVNSESESFFGMFRDVSTKFYALAAKEEERISLSQMLAAEMRFADFYLDFKHEIVKKLDFDKEVPDFKGHAAELSLSFWCLIRFAMAAALKSEKKEFSLTTGHDDENVFVLMKHSGEESGTLDANRIESISAALEILEKYSARVEFDRENGISTVTIRIPCR